MKVQLVQLSSGLADVNVARNGLERPAIGRTINAGAVCLCTCTCSRGPESLERATGYQAAQEASSQAFAVLGR